MTPPSRTALDLSEPFVARKSGKLISKLRLAFVLLLLTTVGLSWYSVDTIRRYDDKLRRISSSQFVLHDIQNMAMLSFHELNSLGDVVQSGRLPGPEDAAPARRSLLREAMANLRQVATAGTEGDWLDAANEPHGDLRVALDRVEELLAAGGRIEQALAGRRTNSARNEWTRLKEAGLPGELAAALVLAVEEQESRIRATITESVTTSPYNSQYVPLMILVAAVLSVTLAWLGFRGLVRSADALRAGAMAFTGGDFTHQIPKLQIAELAGLAEALNAMAAALTSQRKSLQDTAARLEAIIEERTRELTISNRKLAEVDVARLKLLSNISHEFRTPLTAIRGQADIALRGTGKAEEEYKESFRRILRQAQFATDIVDDLLFMARVDAGEPRLEWTPVTVVKLLDAVCKDFETMAKERKQSIERHFKVRNAVVRGDAKRLRQVFAILLDNALRYSKIGSAVEVHAALSGGEIWIEFRDHGIGLTEEDAEKAFDRFYRGQKAQEHSRGTGLGLSVAKVIIEAHHGRITLVGEEGVGAKARVSLALHHQFKGSS